MLLLPQECVADHSTDMARFVVEVSGARTNPANDLQMGG